MRTHNYVIKQGEFIPIIVDKYQSDFLWVLFFYSRSAFLNTLRAHGHTRAHVTPISTPFCFRISVGFSSTVLITGIYKSIFQGVLQKETTADEKEKKKKEEEETQKQTTIEELRNVNSSMVKELERLKDDLRAARILAEKESSGYVEHMFMSVSVCVCVCVCEWVCLS